MNPEVTDVQNEMVAALAMPQRIASLAVSFGLDRYTMTKRVRCCVSAGLVVRVGYGRYVAVTAPRHGAVASERPQSVRDAILAFLTQERQAKEVAAHINRPVPNATSHLTTMARLGLVVRTAYGRYRRADLVPHDSRPCKIIRPTPIRNAILAFLTQERQAKEIADHIGRPVPNATGHLAAMSRRGLVVRTAYGRYQRTDLMMDESRPAKIIRPAPMKDAVLRCLDRPLHFSAVADLLGRPHNSVRSALRWLVASGHAVFRGRGVFAPADDTSMADWQPPPTLRQTILSLLAEPRHTTEIAEHINRSVSATKAHLSVLCRRGLLTRVGYVHYQRSDTVPATSRSATIMRPTPKRDAAQAVLNRPMHCSEVGAEIEVSNKAAWSLLQRLVETGYAVRLGRGIFAPCGSDHCLNQNEQRSVCAARVDAGTGSNPEASCTA